MSILKNKKGIVFTVLALVISSFILIMFFYMIELPVDHGVDVTRTKIRSVNSFLNQIESLSKAQAVTSSTITLKNMTKYMFDNRFFFGDDFDDVFIGCLNGSKEEGFCDDFVEKIEKNLTKFLKENVGLNSNLTVDNINLKHSNPWTLNISFDLNILIEEEFYLWNLSLSLFEEFSIVGFKDPIHAVSALYLRPDDYANISVLNFNDNYRYIDDWREEPSTLNILTRAGQYFESAVYGVSYLNRFRGDFTLPQDHGIVKVQYLLVEPGGPFEGDVGNTDLDWSFWANKDFNEGYIGVYNFTDLGEITSILQVNPGSGFSLEKTINGTKIPKGLAVEANTSSDNYFYEVS